MIDLDTQVTFRKLLAEGRMLVADGAHSEYARAVLELVTYAGGGSLTADGKEVASQLGLDLVKLYTLEYSE